MSIQQKERPPLDAAIITAVRDGFRREDAGKKAIIDDAFVTGLAAMYGYDEKIIETRITYLIDEGVLCHHACGQLLKGSRLVSIVDLDETAKKKGLESWNLGLFLR